MPGWAVPVELRGNDQMAWVPDSIWQSPSNYIVRAAKYLGSWLGQELTFNEHCWKIGATRRRRALTYSNASPVSKD
jgi:hypothetical protein